MRRQHIYQQFKEVIKSLKEQGVVDNSTHAAISKELNHLAHGIAVKSNPEIEKAVTKLSKILWEITR